MRIGFYAPLKTPLHGKPSGDREIGRLLLKALNALGHDVEIVSNLRTWDGRGCKQRQKDIRHASMKEVKRILKKYSTGPAPDLIFTYHIYHKAPDWIGIELATTLNIPYVIAEASFAPKQLNGAWHYGHEQARRCIQRADRIIALNPADIECIKPLIGSENKIDWLKPFLGPIPAHLGSNPDSPGEFSKTGNHSTNSQKPANDYNFNRNTVNLVTVAMMREGDKKASYKKLSEALKKLDATNWKLTVIGDGDAASEIRQFFADLRGECIFAGELESSEVFNHLSHSDIFVWPAVNEALGLALLEAQAFGLPAVAQNYGGVSTIIEDKVTGYVTNPDNIDEFVFALNLLINDSHTRLKMSRDAKRKFESEHSFMVALKRIESIFKRLCNR